MIRAARIMAVATMAAGWLVGIPSAPSVAPAGAGTACLEAPSVGFIESAMRVESINTITGPEIHKFIGWAGLGSTEALALFDACGSNIVDDDTGRIFTYEITSSPGGSVLLPSTTHSSCTVLTNTKVTCAVAALTVLAFSTEQSGQHVVTISTAGFRSLNLCIDASATIPFPPHPSCAQPGVTPTLTGSASAGVPLGGSVSDTAQLAFGAFPTGSIDFTLYGPDDATCAGPAVFTDSATAAGNGDYASASYIPADPGVYRWTVSYSGDGTNDATATACNASNQSVTVGQPDETIVTDCGTVALTTSAGVLADVKVSPVPSSPPPPEGITMPCGLLGFEVRSLSAGASVTITLVVPTAVNGYWKLQDGTWTQLAGVTIVGNTISFTLTDGGVGDDDNVAGQITDPGAPTLDPTAPPTTPPATASAATAVGASPSTTG